MPSSDLSLPDAFVARMRSLLGAEAEALLEALGAPPAVGLRINTLKLTAERFDALADWPTAPVPWSAAGRVVPIETAERVRPGVHPFHPAGLYYLQDPAAMAVAEALAPRAGERVIDLAAAPGGKATHLAALLGRGGLLVANDVSGARVRALGQNLERWGAVNALITQEAPARLAERWGGTFDRVLLDAPCSGEGMFRKSDEALSMWSQPLVDRCAARQDELLADAARLVTPGGRLVYSTCTFAPEENEGVVARFLASHPAFRLEPIALPGTGPGRPDWIDGAPATLSGAARLWPHRGPGEGHFVALLVRQGGRTDRWRPEPATPAPTRAVVLWKAFVATSLAVDPAEGMVLTLRRDQLYAHPESTPRLAGLRWLRAGLWLGTIRKERIEPSHSLALALAPGEAAHHTDLAPDDPRLLAYLRGEPLELAGPDGWLTITVAGYALGWGKRSRTVVNNRLPKGLRR